MIENCFQAIYSAYFLKKPPISLQEIKEISINFFISLQNIINNVKFHSLSIQKFEYSHGFLLENIFDLCKEIKKIFTLEFAKRNKIKEDLPFVYLIESSHLFFQGFCEEPDAKPTDKYNNFKIFNKFEEMQEFFASCFANNTERVILENPKIIIFISSYCIMKTFQIPKEREECELDIAKLKNFDSCELSSATQTNQKYKVPRNFFLKATISVGKISLDAYNMNWELLTSLVNQISQISEWSEERISVMRHITLQKLGHFCYKLPLRKKNLNKNENEFINLLNQMHVPSVAEMKLDRMKPFTKIPEINEAKEENVIDLQSEKKTNVTKAILNRVENLFPVKENYQGFKFQDYFKKVKFL